MRDVTKTAEQVLELAIADPERALRLAESFPVEGPGISHRERVTLLRATSVANRVLGRFEDALDLAEQARTTAEDAGDDEQHLLAIVTMIGPMVVLGQATEALELLDSSVNLATTPYLESRLSYQRGVVWQLQGEAVRAVAAFEEALPAFREVRDREMIRATLHGLGYQRLVIGALSEAQRDLEEALAIAIERHEEPIVSGLKHHLGLLASYRGDITEALRLLLESEEIYMRLTGSPAPQHVARCEVLLSAGLFREAYQLATQIAGRHRTSGDPEHLADALHVAARAALMAGDLLGALNTAEEAAEVFQEQQRPTHAIDARRIAIGARYGIEGASAELLRAATDVAESLESEQHMVAATEARLLAGEIAIDLGDLVQAVGWLERVSKIGKGPVELRIQGRLATARLRRLGGDNRAADAAARSGLGLIDEYQSALGATDLRMGIEQHGAELGHIGLDLGLDSGDPRRILRWMERTRARALRHRPVIADEDDEVGDALARLRRVEAELRVDHSDNRLERQRRQLQETIRTADRLRRAGTKSDERFDVEALISWLGDRSLLEIALHDGRLIGVKVSGGRARRLELGLSEPALRELAHVRFAMRRAARRNRKVEVGSLEALDELLFGDTMMDEDEVVLVPPPALIAAPWAVLPRLRGKVVSVSPSAEIWWRSNRDTSVGEGVVIAGGPDLDAAESEVNEIARLYHDTSVFPPGATVEAVKEAIAGASLAHIAAHAAFNSENPMFSSLRLGDGDLNVYDIERLKTPPSIVVLSACDSGYTEARAGVELAGLTSALLSMGTRSVVASVGLVPDSSATRDLMVRFHRRLVTGMTPAEALSAAQLEGLDDPVSLVAAASFISVGA